MAHPFKVGEFYEDRKGRYQVIDIDARGVIMKIRYVNSKKSGWFRVDIKKNIWENLQSENDQEQNTSSLRTPVEPTFLPRWNVYKIGALSSPLLAAFAEQESVRSQRFWQRPGISWDEARERLTISDGITMRLSRPRSGQVEGLVPAILHLGRLAFHSDDRLRNINYGEEMAAIGFEMLRKPQLLLSCAEGITQRRANESSLDRFIADELLSLYLYACLRAGPDCFISHVDLVNDQTVLGHLATPTLQDLRDIAPHAVLTIGWHLPVDALNLLAPDFTAGETWVSTDSLADCEKALDSYFRGRDLTSAVNRIVSECWGETHRNRRYGSPSRGHAEILASHPLLSAMGLRVIRFVQEGTGAPGVHLRLGFGKPPCQIGVVRVRPGGEVRGFHDVQSRALQDVIRAVALTYYRDLVVPSQEVRYVTEGPNPQHILPHTGSTLSASPEPRILPRQQHEYYHSPGSYASQGLGVRPLGFHEWYLTQERELHSVVSHTRWVSDEFVADRDKQLEALEAGVVLPPGYTWVAEHERGGHGGELRLRGGNLARRMLFAAPDRANDDLVRLFG